jgi:SAM-dependent methyltransferase
MTDARTQAVYQDRAADYAARQEGRQAPGLAEFIALLPAGAPVLDLGCGPGLHAGVMAAAGLKVLAVDASPAMVAMAAGRPGVTALQAGFDEIATLGGGFAGVWASFSLLHATRADFGRHLRDLHPLCLPDAAVVLGMKLGTGEGRDRLDRFYSYYSEPELRAELTAAGFRPGPAIFGRGPGLADEPSDWIVLTSRS